MSTTTHPSTVEAPVDPAVRFAQCKEEGNSLVKQAGVVFCYVTLRYVTLRYSTLCYITVRYVMLRYVTLCCVTVRYVMFRYVTLLLCFVTLATTETE